MTPEKGGGSGKDLRGSARGQPVALSHLPVRSETDPSRSTLFQRYKNRFRASDQAREQGVLRFESGAYTPVREHFGPQDNAAIGP